MTSMKRAIIIILDGVGAGEAADASAYGDSGSNTLAHVARAVGGFNLPALAACGLGNALHLEGMPPDPGATGAWGRMHPASAGKDSTTGHWEIAGVHLARAFRTYPRGFPAEVLAEGLADIFIARHQPINVVSQASKADRIAFLPILPVSHRVGTAQVAIGNETDRLAGNGWRKIGQPFGKQDGAEVGNVPMPTDILLHQMIG